jgi:hypothetical protein
MPQQVGNLQAQRIQLWLGNAAVLTALINSRMVASGKVSGFHGAD